jgi:hypothetical protein
VAWKQLFGLQKHQFLGGFGFAFPEKQAPTNGTSDQIRWCDWIAILLANEKHILFFDPFLNIEKRDAEIKAPKTSCVKNEQGVTP